MLLIEKKGKEEEKRFVMAANSFQKIQMSGDSI
jgi:hypothetical protein